MVNDTLKFKNMATKRNSKTLEQQARYYEVDDISEYMVETYLNGNISTYRQLFQELRGESRREAESLLDGSLKWDSPPPI